MKTKKLLSLMLVFLMILTSSVWVFAEEVTPQSYMTSEMIELRDRIAEKIKDTEDDWVAMDMSLYEKIPQTTTKMSSEMKQKIVDNFIQKMTSDEAILSDATRCEIVLKSIGIDSKELYALNSITPFNNVEFINECDLMSMGIYQLPWVLMADFQGNLNLTEETTTTLLALLENNSQSGTFSYEWEGVLYPDFDTASIVVSALAPLYNDNYTAKTIIDDVKASILSNISETGSLGSANTDAMAIIACIAMGENPLELKNSVTEKNIVDGLLSYVNETNDGFTFYGFDNALATEQAFRALIALSLYDGNAYNIYDFSDNEVVAGREKSDSFDTEEDITPPDDEEETFNVTLTIEAKELKWIDNMTIAVENGATVCDALIAGITATNMSQVGAENGYVSSITKDGVTLSEFGAGKNSGWLYKVNGIKGTVSLKDYVLNENDNILWYYETDWKTDDTMTDIFGPSSSGGYNKPSKPSVPNDTNEEKEEEKPTSTDKNDENIPSDDMDQKEENEKIVLDDVNDHWASNSISFVLEKKLMNGIDEKSFGPDLSATRAQIVTILYRLSNDKTVASDIAYNDVYEESWYSDAVLWASSQGIALGINDKTFAPNTEITREQLVVFMYRFAQNNNISTEKSNEEFVDNNKISIWAKDAFSWAKAQGIIEGKSDGSADPKSLVTRGEIATVLERFINIMEK